MLNGKGASLLDGYMEDLATDRIYRLMIAQRVRHKVKTKGDNGNTMEHTAELITRIFDEELAKIQKDLPAWRLIERPPRLFPKRAVSPRR